MKNLELDGLHLQELDAKEFLGVDGGMGYNAGGYGLLEGGRKGEARFYIGLVKGFYSAFFG